jgi:cytochrome c oxidase cbb3-type subunit 2
VNRVLPTALGILLMVFAPSLVTLYLPAVQLGNLPMAVLQQTGQNYPLTRSGAAQRGAKVYLAQGCQHCHTRQVRSLSEGSDLERGWGPRRTVARDYLQDHPLLLGSLRLGPDLANLGLRATNDTALLLRLYDPRLARPDALMPAHPCLFEHRRVATGQGPSPEALTLPESKAPPPGWEVVPKPAALDLAAYLRSLQATDLFFEVYPPLPPPSSTNPAITGAAAFTNVPSAASQPVAP